MTKATDFATLGKRRVWIVGASSGIGAELARQLAKEPRTSLILSARQETLLNKVAAVCRQSATDTEVSVLPVDVCDREGIEAAVNRITDDHSGIDTLIVSSGVSQRSLAVDTLSEVDRRIMEVNYFGTTTVIRHVLPLMQAQHHGQIAVISSIAGKLGTPLRSSYAASKHALHGFLDCLRSEVHACGIDVMTVCPGYIQTDITLKSLTGDGTPYGRIDRAIAEGLPVEECARQILEAMRKRKPEVIVSRLRERLGIYLMRISPQLFFNIAKRLELK